MEDKDVFVKLRDSHQWWDTALNMTEQDALQIQELFESMRSGIRTNLPSINGFAEIQGINLELTYSTRESISVPIALARPVIEQAIESAAANRQSEAARIRLWDWVNERYEGTRVLTVVAGEQVEAILLKSEDEHVAIKRSDGSVAITDVANEGQIPAVGLKVVLKLDEDRATIISAQ